MLARKAVVGQVKSDVLVASQGRKRSASVALDLSPMMWQVVYGIAALVAFLLIMMVMNAYSTKLGYEVVKTQQAVVQLTKDNDALDGFLEVSRSYPTNRRTTTRDGFA
jgi:hypothetical protein